MSLEIERKFLVEGDGWRAEAVSFTTIEQGYVSRRARGTVRVRIRDERAFLTVKGLNRGAVRSEWEYEIPVEDARAMLAEVCEGSLLRKTRAIVDGGDGLLWEVDEFHAPERVAGLVVAEIELPHPDTPFTRPGWLGREVTGDAAYYNSQL